jgi:peptidoglycan/xylan/chitin deacetylase (PgdA/CDA1 family)
MMRQTIKSALLRTPLPGILLRRRSRKHLTVLAYHRIHPLPDSNYAFDADLISATPEEFARELDYFRRHLDVLSMQALLDGLERRVRLPERPAVITFDDGYRDNCDIATPILRERGLTACFFLSTRLVGTDRIPWWDQVSCCMRFARVACVLSPFGDDDPPYLLDMTQRRQSKRRFLHHLKRTLWPRALQCLDYLCAETGVNPADHAESPLFMSWDAARSMRAAGMEIGGHTRTHPIVAQVDNPHVLREEIRGCYEDLCQFVGERPIAFAYPVGSPEAMSPLADAEIHNSGFRISFSYIHAFARADSGVCRVPRLRVEYGDDYDAFRLGMALAPRDGGRDLGRCRRPLRSSTPD